MNQFISKALLLFYCFFVLYQQPLNQAFVVAFLLCILFTSVMYSVSFRSFPLSLSLCYGILALFFPNLALFFPVLFYDIAAYRLYPAGVIFTACYFLHYFQTDPLLCFFLCFGSLLAVFLEYINDRQQQLLNQLHRQRDEDTELTLLLRQKNQHLLATQNYEIKNATLRERNRIAREIHDNVGHMLSRSILMLGALKAVNEKEELKDPLDTLHETLSEAMNNIRRSVHDLHDESINLEESIRKLVHDFTFCRIELEYDMGLSVPKDIKYALIMILKEALTNVSRHSNASLVTVRLREHPALYQMIIHDNGTGYPERSPHTTEPDGIGLTNISDRIQALEGSLQISENSGFQLFITLPRTTK